jgi:hypothetical protein
MIILVITAIPPPVPTKCPHISITKKSCCGCVESPKLLCFQKFTGLFRYRQLKVQKRSLHGAKFDRLTPEFNSIYTERSEIYTIHIII